MTAVGAEDASGAVSEGGGEGDAVWPGTIRKGDDGTGRSSGGGAVASGGAAVVAAVVAGGGGGALSAHESALSDSATRPVRTKGREVGGGVGAGGGRGIEG